MRETADEGLTQILIALDVIAEMAINPQSAPEVAACSIKLRQIKGRAELILCFIDALRPPPAKIGKLQ